MKISARALQELLAGKLSYKSFETHTGFGAVFRNKLDSGQVISGIELESGGTDKDDDYIVFKFENDAAADELKTGPGK